MKIEIIFVVRLSWFVVLAGGLLNHAPIARLQTGSFVDASFCNDGIYIHIPFCRRRCFYCNFPIKVLGERVSTINDASQHYTDIILREIDTVMVASTGLVDSIYFGGGTPSLLATQGKVRRMYH